MKILYSEIDGKIFYAVPDKDYFFFTHSTNVPLVELDIDELAPDNRTLCVNVINTIGKTDDVKELKYIVSEGVLQEKEGWVEEIIDV